MVHENCILWFNYEPCDYYVDFFVDVVAGDDLENVDYLQNISPKPEYAVSAIKSKRSGAFPFAALKNASWVVEQDNGCTVKDSLSHIIVNVDEYLDMVENGDDTIDVVVFDDDMFPDTVECDAEYVSVWEDTEIHSDVKVHFTMKEWPLSGEIVEWGERWFVGEPPNGSDLENITEEYVTIIDNHTNESIVFTAMNENEFLNYGKDDPTYYSNENGIITY